jgi:NAD(P)-dependent dehydrogenase (short-subunit alcohol dehydrogenase family)
MREFAGKTAFITGAASGIGLALARTFLDRGMNVMMADVEQAALDAAAHGLSN